MEVWKGEGKEKRCLPHVRCRPNPQGCKHQLITLISLDECAKLAEGNTKHLLPEFLEMKYMYRMLCMYPAAWQLRIFIFDTCVLFFSAAIRRHGIITVRYARLEDPWLRSFVCFFLPLE